MISNNNFIVRRRRVHQRRVPISIGVSRGTSGSHRTHPQLSALLMHNDSTVCVCVLHIFTCIVHLKTRKIPCFLISVLYLSDSAYRVYHCVCPLHISHCRKLYLQSEVTLVPVYAYHSQCLVEAEYHWACLCLAWKNWRLLRDCQHSVSASYRQIPNYTVCNNDPAQDTWSFDGCGKNTESCMATLYTNSNYRIIVCNVWVCTGTKEAGWHV